MNTKNWYDEHKTRTLADLREAGEAMEYIDGSDDDDLFIEWKIINPNNDQKLAIAWVPVDIVAECEYDIQRTKTTQYHSWSNTIADRLYDDLNDIGCEYCVDNTPSIIEAEAVQDLENHVSQYGSLISSTVDESSFNFI